MGRPGGRFFERILHANQRPDNKNTDSNALHSVQEEEMFL